MQRLNRMIAFFPTTGFFVKGSKTNSTTAMAMMKMADTGRALLARAKTAPKAAPPKASFHHAQESLSRRSNRSAAPAKSSMV